MGGGGGEDYSNSSNNLEISNKFIKQNANVHVGLYPETLTFKKWALITCYVRIFSLLDLLISLFLKTSDIEKKSLKNPDKT